MIIALDFDGTIVNGDNYPEISSAQLLAKDVIQRWVADGVKIIINSCRTGRYEGMAVDFLEKEEIPFHYFNCNLPDSVVKYKMDCRKISADLYIDDKNLGGLPSWTKIDMLVREHKMYPKNDVYIVRKCLYGERDTEKPILSVDLKQ